MRLLPFSPTALENVFIYWAFCRFLLQSCCFFICHGTGQSGINVCSVQEIRLYVVLFLPYTVQYVTSSFTQISDSLMAAGQVFGGSPVYILRRITLPLIRQGIATGWMMTFIIAFRELVTASLIAPPNTLVVSTFIVREFEQGSVSVGMAMAVLCVLFSTTALLILNTVIDHRKVH